MLKLIISDPHQEDAPGKECGIKSRRGTGMKEPGSEAYGME